MHNAGHVPGEDIGSPSHLPLWRRLGRGVALLATGVTAGAGAGAAMGAATAAAMFAPEAISTREWGWLPYAALVGAYIGAGAGALIGLVATLLFARRQSLVKSGAIGALMGFLIVRHVWSVTAGPHPLVNWPTLSGAFSGLIASLVVMLLLRLLTRRWV